MNSSPVARASPAYRPDIDGLRALAVVLVVLFHARVPWMGGGYIGVDLFYVISGYLITQLLLGSGERPLRISLGQFYLRRARRILPALLVTCLVVSLAAFVLLLPWDLVRFAKYLLAVPVMATNLPAWSDGGNYFVADSSVSLTHLWSIAIEEQFYLVYPLTLLVLGRFVPRWRTAALTLLALLSVGVCLWGSFFHPIANFYFLLSRAWELLLGALVAVRGVWNVRPVWREGMAWAALIAIALVVILPGPDLAYPGPYTLVPCVACALLLGTAASVPTRLSRVLSWRPLVLVGLASYSIYLWHLPVLALFRYFHITAVDAFDTCVLIAVIFVLAFASWSWIEQPIRTRSLARSDRTFVTGAVLANLALLAVGVSIWAGRGFPNRFPAEVTLPNEAQDADLADMGRCMTLPLEQVAAGKLCSFGLQRGAAPSVIVWGDSHALALIPAYRQLAVAHGMRLYLAATSNCRPLVSFANADYPSIARAHCVDFNDAVVRAIRSVEPALVILNAHWIDTDTELVSTEPLIEGKSRFRQGLESTLRKVSAAGRVVCGVLDVPSYPYQVPYALAMARRRALSEDFLRITRAAGYDQFALYDREFRALGKLGALAVADPKDLLCRAAHCSFEENGRILYVDTNHLSPAGAELVASTLEPCFSAVSDATAMANPSHAVHD